MNSLYAGKLNMLFLSSADFFFKIIISIKNSFSNTGVSNSFKPDQAQQNVWPDLGPKLFAKVYSSLQQIIKFAASKDRVNFGANNIMLFKILPKYTCFFHGPTWCQLRNIKHNRNK